MNETTGVAYALVITWILVTFPASFSEDSSMLLAGIFYGPAAGAGVTTIVNAWARDKTNKWRNLALIGAFFGIVDLFWPFQLGLVLFVVVFLV